MVLKMFAATKKYSGRLAYWRHISNEFFMVSPSEYGKLSEIVPDEMKSDIMTVTQNWNQYKGVLMKIGHKVNEKYLKSQGVSEGLRSYNRLVVLVSAWRKRGEG